MSRKRAAPKTKKDAVLTALGASIRHIRTSQGLSQEELADMAHLDRTYVSGVERGVRNTSIKAVWRIAEALQIPVNQLLCDAEARFEDQTES